MSEVERLLSAERQGWPLGPGDASVLAAEVRRLRAENASLRHDISCYQGPRFEWAGQWTG